MHFRRLYLSCGIPVLMHTPCLNVKLYSNKQTIKQKSALRIDFCIHILCKFICLIGIMRSDFFEIQSTLKLNRPAAIEKHLSFSVHHFLFFLRKCFGRRKIFPFDLRRSLTHSFQNSKYYNLNVIFKYRQCMKAFFSGEQYTALVSCVT